MPQFFLKKPISKKVSRTVAVRGAAKASLGKASDKPRPHSTQVEKILARASRWCGSEQAAKIWYRSEPIPALGNRTAQAVVRSGNSKAVLFYLESIDAGAFA